MDAWGETDDNRWTILYFLILIHFGLNNKIIDISCQRKESGPLRKKVWLPPQMFEFVSDVPNVATSEYKCLLGCIPKTNADGSIKFLRVSNTSRHNAKRHIEVFL